MAQHTETFGTTRRGVSGLFGFLQQRCRKAGHALSSTEERQAVDNIAWPLPIRIAGYVTILSALASSLPDTLHQGAFTTAISLGLWALFSTAAVLFVRGDDLTFAHRLKLFLAQVVAATALLYVSFSGGPELLFYMLAAEIQFLLPFRTAIYGTVGLYMMLVGNAILAAPASYHNQLVQFCLMAPAGFIFVAAFTRSAVTELIQRRRSTLLLEELHEAHTRLQEYADRVEELAVARERNRMAREIHDTLGHYLTVINIQIETAQKLSSRDPERSQTALRTAKELATECLNEVRRSVSALRPAALEDVSLSDALTQLVDEMRRSTDAVMHLETRGEGALQPAIEVIAYRVIQEALTNVRKHSAARNVWVRMEWNRERLTASVLDDGRGAEPMPDVTGFLMNARDGGLGGGHGGSYGLRGMQERLARVGGRLDIHTEPGAGFRVELHVPHPLDPVSPDVALEEAVSA